MTIWYILCSFGNFSGFGIMYIEKSGNPVYEGYIMMFVILIMNTYIGGSTSCIQICMPGGNDYYV
jgi:hypothetical protein